MIRPLAPRPGARVALVAPAGPLPEGAIERAARRVESLGWTPEIGPNAAGRHGYLAAPDAARLADLNAAIADPEVDMIWALRGGYGTMRILEKIDWSGLLDRPRPLVGFSDNTALHLAAAREGLVTLHGPHPATAEFSDFSREALLAALRPEAAGVLPGDPEAAAPTSLAGGTAEGVLVGGNLSLLAATIGTPYQVQTRDAILFLEEVGEPGYRLDRLLSQLLLAGVLADVAGIAIGAISDAPDADADHLPSPVDILADRLGALGVPVVAGFPFGHIDRSWTLPHGVRARLDAAAPSLELLEPAVTGAPA